MSDGSTICGGSSEQPATQQKPPTGSITAILEWIDPTTLSPEVQTALRELGPYLASGLNLTETAERFGRRRDWARDRVQLIRSALIDAALERADEMDSRLREHLEGLRGTTA